jgi:hypothetical protein
MSAHSSSVSFAGGEYFSRDDGLARVVERAIWNQNSVRSSKRTGGSAQADRRRSQ